MTGIHAYAAKLHDNRFRQMEGGLPERYRKEQEMARTGRSEFLVSGKALAMTVDRFRRMTFGALDYLPPGEVSFAAGRAY